MSFFPPGFDPRADVIGILHLAAMDTPDGVVRFMLGTDGKFVDFSGNVWWGSKLIEVPEIQEPINGLAPAIVVNLTYFSDPDDPDDLTAQIRTLGSDYVKGYKARFYVQPLMSHDDIVRPQIDPILRQTLVMRHIAIGMSGPMERSLSLSLETSAAGRNEARGFVYNTADHARLIGSPNSTLQYMPTDLFTEQKIFG